jgi:hypothetical protein
MGSSGTQLGSVKVHGIHDLAYIGLSVNLFISTEYDPSRLANVTLPENAGTVGKFIGILSEVCPLDATRVARR